MSIIATSLSSSSSRVARMHAGRIGPTWLADERQAVDASRRVRRQAELSRGNREAGRRSSPREELVLGEGAVGPLADRLDVETEEGVAHRRVAGDHDLENALRAARKLLDGVREVGDQSALEDPPRMLGVVADSCHDVASTEALRVLERRRGDERARLEIHEAQHDRRRRPMSAASPWDRPRSSATASPSMKPMPPARRTAGSSGPAASRARSTPTPPASPPPQRPAAHDAVVAEEPRTAREAESLAEVRFFTGARREPLHAFRDIDDALAALAVLEARRRHTDARLVGAVEERCASPGLHRDGVDLESNRHARLAARTG
jgi:hypothetical protein